MSAVGQGSKRQCATFGGRLRRSDGAMLRGFHKSWVFDRHNTLSADIEGAFVFDARARAIRACSATINGELEISGSLRDMPAGRPNPLERHKCPLGIYVDVDEERVTRPALTTWAAGKLRVPSRETELDGWQIVNNLYVEPIEGTLLKMPAPFSTEWDEQNVHPFDKWSTADFDFSEPAKWSDANQASFLPFINGKNLAAGSTATLKVPLERNRGLFMVEYKFGVEASNNKAYKRIEWPAAGHDPFFVAFDIYATGEVEMLYAIAGDPTIFSAGSVNVAGSGKHKKDITRTGVALVILPFRQREVLVVSKHGHGGILACPWIDESDPNPEVFPKAKVKMTFFKGGANNIHGQKLSYLSAGWAAAIQTTFKKAPGAGESHKIAFYLDQIQIGAHLANFTLVKTDDTSTAFVPDGILDQARLRFDISGDTKSTPFLNGAVAWFGPLTDKAVGPEVEITDETADLTIEWGEHPQNHRAEFDLYNPTGSAASKVTTRFNRPAEVRLCDFTVARGPLEVKERELCFTNEEAEVAPFEIGSSWDQLKKGRFEDVVPFDNLTITEAFKLIAEYAGLGVDRFRVSEDPYRLELGNTVSCHEFALAAMPGDTFASWLDRLRDDFCATWHMGFELVEEGVPRLIILKPEDLETEPAITLYLSEEEAEADGVDPAETEITRRYLVRHGWKERFLPPEANSIEISGYDPRRARPIYVLKPDLPSQDVTLAEDDRPDNWVGEKWPFLLQDPAISTQSVATRATNIAFDRLTKRRRISTCMSGWWFDETGKPLITGRVVKLRRRTSEDPEEWEETKWRIKKVRVKSVKEPKTSDSIGSEGWMLRNASYVLEEIGEALIDKAGADLKMIGWDADLIYKIRAQLPKWLEVVRTRPGDSTFIKGLPTKVIKI